MSSIANFKRRSQRSGITQKEKMVTELRRNFEKQVKESPSGYIVQATLPDDLNITSETRWMKCLINNVTLNDQRVLDEKYLHVFCDEDIEIGCYIYWQNAYWLLIFMEHNSIESHKTFTMRRCNQVIKHRYNNKVWDIPVSIENLTINLCRFIQKCIL